MRIITVLCMFVFFLAVPAYADFNSAMSAYERKHYTGAFREFRNLAQQDHAEAQYMVGYLYLRGEGAPQDYVQAHKWFNLAAWRGKPKAARARDELARRMTSAQIAEAQRLARAWKPQRQTTTYKRETSQSERADTSVRLSRNELIKIQELLTSFGYSSGLADGVIGFKTREAIRKYQEDQGLPVDGRPSGDLLGHLSQTLAEKQRPRPRRYARRWPGETGGRENTQKLVESLKSLTVKIQRRRVSSRWITDRLWVLINQYDWPWQNLLISDGFHDGDYTYNPTWTVASGRFQVIPNIGLKSSVTRTRKQVSKQESKDDLAGLLFKTLLKPDSQKGPEKKWIDKIHPAEIYIDQPITNSFAVRMVFKSYTGNGRLEFGPFQGPRRKIAYRVAYIPQRRNGIRLVRQTRFGSSVIDLYRRQINLEDGRLHTIEWLRDKRGEMIVSLDGKELVRSLDRSLSTGFDGFSIINRKGQYDIRSVTVYGAK
ncbi:MAG: SEL1-like repeat protein [Candidatus Adiutricales bacterium]